MSKTQNPRATGTEERLLSRLQTTATILGPILAILLVAYAVTVTNAPIDRIQGVIQKILYVHPPLAYGAYLGFIVTAFAGATYLWKGSENADRLALSGAEVGLLFCTLMMITGPIWARGTWGQWWSWDPRLTATLLLWLIYLAYLLLRAFGEPGPRTARLAAVYGIVGALLIPINYYVIDLFGGRSMHPENLKQGSLGAGMGLPFAVANLTLGVAFLYLLAKRWQLEILRFEAAREQALEGERT